MKFQNPSLNSVLNGRKDERTNERTNKRTNERTSRKQYAPHFFKVGGIITPISSANCPRVLNLILKLCCMYYRVL